MSAGCSAATPSCRLSRVQGEIEQGGERDSLAGGEGAGGRPQPATVEYLPGAGEGVRDRDVVVAHGSSTASASASAPSPRQGAAAPRPMLNRRAMVPRRFLTPPLRASRCARE